MDASALLVEKAQIILSFFNSLIGSLSKPIRSISIALLGALTLSETKTKIQLSYWVALISSFMEPIESLAFVFLYPEAEGKKYA